MAIEKVEIVEGDFSVEVEPKFYKVALGIMKLRVPLMDVLQGEGDDFFSLVFMDPDHLEFVAEFLLHHGMFAGPLPDADIPGMTGNFHIQMHDDGDIVASYFLDIPESAQKSLETCLMSHLPSPTGALN